MKRERSTVSSPSSSRDSAAAAADRLMCRLYREKQKMINEIPGLLTLAVWGGAHWFVEIDDKE